jgi:hypothetical protein
MGTPLEGFSRDRPEAQPRLCAGLIYRRETEARNPISAQWLTQLLSLAPDDGYGPFVDPRAYDDYRVYRELPLEQLAKCPTLAAQSEMLAEFALTTFDLLRTHAPSR